MALGQNIQWAPQDNSQEDFARQIVMSIFQNVFQNKMQDNQWKKQQQQQALSRQQSYAEAEKMGVLSKEPYQEVPVQGGTAQVSPMQGIKIPTKYKYSLNQRPGMQTSVKFNEQGLPQFGQETINPLDTQYKESQLDLNREILKNYKEGTAGGRVFRDIATGEEVDENTALKGMQQGSQYNVFLRTPTRSGSIERKIAEPPKLSENEKDFISGYKQTSKDMDSLISQLTPETKAPLGGFARISTRKRFLVPEENLRKIQELYTRVIKTFLFGPAGKALTGTEREVLEMAATPTGKSPEEWERDIVAAKTVIDDKYNLLVGRQYPVGQTQDDFSNMSDEELRRIAGGG